LAHDGYDEQSVLALGIGGATAQAILQQLQERNAAVILCLAACVPVDRVSADQDADLIVAADNIWGSRITARLDTLSWALTQPLRGEDKVAGRGASF